MAHPRWPSANDELRRRLKGILEQLLQARGGTLPGGVTQSNLNGMPPVDLFDLAQNLLDAGEIDKVVRERFEPLFARARVPREEDPESTPGQ